LDEGKETMEGRIISVIVVVAIVCLVAGAGATYVLDQSRIDDMKKGYDTQMNRLENDIEDTEEFNRLLFKAMDEVTGAYINDGCTRAYGKEAQASYDLGLYDQAELYCLYAMDYSDHANDGLRAGILSLNQAIDFAVDGDTLDFLGKYVEMLNATMDVIDSGKQRYDHLRRASIYYNQSLWDQGDDEIGKLNALTDDHNDYVEIMNTLLSELDILLEKPWKD
jgi:hypothetical protein